MLRFNVNLSLKTLRALKALGNVEVVEFVDNYDRDVEKYKSHYEVLKIALKSKNIRAINRKDLSIAIHSMTEIVNIDFVKQIFNHKEIGEYITLIQQLSFIKTGDHGLDMDLVWYDIIKDNIRIFNENVMKEIGEINE